MRVFLYRCLNCQQGSAPLLWQLCYHGNALTKANYLSAKSGHHNNLFVRSFTTDLILWLNSFAWLHAGSNFIGRPGPDASSVPLSNSSHGNVWISGQTISHFHQGYKHPYFSTVCAAAVGNIECHSLTFSTCGAAIMNVATRRRVLLGTLK